MPARGAGGGCARDCQRRAQETPSLIESLWRLRSRRLRHAGGGGRRLQGGAAGDDSTRWRNCSASTRQSSRPTRVTLDTYARSGRARPRSSSSAIIGDRKLLQIGEKLWPLPFPLVKGEDGKWAFDTDAGLEEIVNRRVGENELQTIETMRAYVDAQEDYAPQDRDEDGVEEFAQKLISSEGADRRALLADRRVNGESPAGDFVDQAELDDAGKGEGYFGYRYRILTGQGDNIAGGAYDYVINGNMIAGFALIAWPAKYAETGVNTFASTSTASSTRPISAPIPRSWLPGSGISTRTTIGRFRGTERSSQIAPAERRAGYWRFTTGTRRHWRFQGRAAERLRCISAPAPPRRSDLT